MSSKLETYYVLIDGDEDEPEPVHLKSDVDATLEDLRKENERLRGLLDHLNSINYSASGELGNLWPITGELQDQIDAALEEQDPTSD